MNLLVIGGRLQGVEAAYLAAEAGIETTVVDLEENAPATGLCSRFIQGDALDAAFLTERCREADVILPACEDMAVLDALEQASRLSGVPLIYHREAYAVSSSKLVSDRMFARLGIPAPLPWPDCGFPVIAKPSCASGSKDVRVLHSNREVQQLQAEYGSDGLVLQQYMEGPSFSIEVVGDGKQFAALQSTELFMDHDYDCCRVLAPAALGDPLDRELRALALRIAKELGIRGIFDVEVILHEGVLKILEIDARIPSQTPTAVYHSSGINMVDLLAKAALGQPVEEIAVHENRACLYEHIRVRGDTVEVLGEHCMGSSGPLRRIDGFFGADTALTSYRPGAREWVATLIFAGASRAEVMERQRQTLAGVMPAPSVSR